MIPTIGSNGFLLPANQISTVGRELWAATSVVSIFHTYLSVSVSIFHTYLSVFFTHIRLQSEYLSQIFTIDISSLPKKPPVTTWDLTQRLLLTQTLTTINFSRLLMIRLNNRPRDQLTKNIFLWGSYQKYYRPLYPGHVHRASCIWGLIEEKQKLLCVMCHLHLMKSTLKTSASST